MRTPKSPWCWGGDSDDDDGEDEGSTQNLGRWGKFALMHSGRRVVRAV